MEGGNNVYYDAVSGYGNNVKGNSPKNIIYGVYNTITGLGDVGVYGYNNTITGQYSTVIGRSNTVTASNAFLIGRSNTLSQNHAFAYGSDIGGVNLNQHGFGTLTPSARMHVKSLFGVPTLLIDGGEIQANSYGTGTKEAADLSKTQSNYIAGFATDGTVLDLNVDTLLKKEKYFTITSTSSPQTLSNNFSDNLINQGGTQATFTLTFPASPVDGQVLKITYNNAITTLTLDGNGNTIVGSAVTTGVAGSQRAFKFYSGIGWIKLY